MASRLNPIAGVAFPPGRQRAGEREDQDISSPCVVPLADLAQVFARAPKQRAGRSVVSELQVLEPCLQAASSAFQSASFSLHVCNSRPEVMNK